MSSKKRPIKTTEDALAQAKRAYEEVSLSLCTFVGTGDMVALTFFVQGLHELSKLALRGARVYEAGGDVVAALRAMREPNMG